MTVLADSTSYVDWPSMGKILLISIAAGAGLVTVYSVGLLALSASGYLRGTGAHDGKHASEGVASEGVASEGVASEGVASEGAASAGVTSDLADEVVTRRRNVVSLIAALVCLAIVVGAAVYGIHVMLAKG
jgi:hypothetical protein